MTHTGVYLGRHKSLPVWVDVGGEKGLDVEAAADVKVELALVCSETVLIL